MNGSDNQDDGPCQCKACQLRRLLLPHVEASLAYEHSIKAGVRTVRVLASLQEDIISAMMAACPDEHRAPFLMELTSILLSPIGAEPMGMDALFAEGDGDDHVTKH